MALKMGNAARTIIALSCAILLNSCGTAPVQPANPFQTALSYVPTGKLEGKPIFHKGHPALELVSNDGSSLYIERAGFRGQVAYEIPAELLLNKVYNYDQTTCIGNLYVTANSLGFIPVPTQSCGGSKTIPKSQASFNGLNSVFASGYAMYAFEFDNYSNSDSTTDNLKGYLIWSSPLQSITVIRPDEEVAANAEAWISLLLTDFYSADQHFAQLTSSLGVIPQTSEIQETEATGDAAYRQGNHEKALQEYIKALILLSDDEEMLEPSAEVSLRQKIITLVAQMSFKPRIPDAALRHEADGREAAREAQGIDDLLNNAIPEFQQAVNIAPWWADGYWNLAVALKNAKLYNQAAQNLQYYLLTNPNAPNAASIKMEIYTLQYQAQHQ